MSGNDGVWFIAVYRMYDLQYTEVRGSLIQQNPLVLLMTWQLDSLLVQQNN